MSIFLIRNTIFAYVSYKLSKTPEYLFHAPWYWCDIRRYNLFQPFIINLFDALNILTPLNNMNNNLNPLKTNPEHTRDGVYGKCML